MTAVTGGGWLRAAERPSTPTPALSATALVSGSAAHWRATLPVTPGALTYTAQGQIERKQLPDDEQVQPSEQR